jgi:hypothetical protein
MFLMPPSLVDWLPSDHLVFFVKEVLEAIDLSPITVAYEREERGYPPYHPNMMTGVLCCMGIAWRKLGRDNNQSECVETQSYELWSDEAGQ